MKASLEDTGDEIETTGMVNIHRRIRLVFGEESGLLLARNAWGGLKVEIVLEKKRGNEDVQTFNS
jgi:two-component system sensor histidine kinase YesM